MKRIRTHRLEFLDTLTFPFRALTIFEENRWGFSSLRTERFDYVSREVKGYCLDVGCGRNNIFIRKFLNNRGKGIDVFAYEGLKKDEVLDDITHFPFPDQSFDTATFIANLNHIPEPERDTELREAFRVLKNGGNVIVTMGNPFIEILVHKLVVFYTLVFHAKVDMDSERGMKEGENYYLKKSEILHCLKKAGFTQLTRKRFLSQWGLNSLYIGWKY